MFLALMLAQVIVPTPVPIATSTPAAASMSQLLDNVVGDAASKARALDGTLGVVVIDLGTGTHASRNADRLLPTQSVQKLPIAVLVYRAIDKGALAPDKAVTVDTDDLVHHVSDIADNYAKRQTYSVQELLDGMIESSDNTAAKALLRILGGVDAANAGLSQLSYGGIILDPDDNGAATANDLARLLRGLTNGSLLSASSQKKLLDQLAGVRTFPGRLRAGFPPNTHVMHKTGTSQTIDGITDATNDIGLISVNGRTVIVVALLQGARGDDRRRDGLIAGIARGVYNATLQFPI